MNDETWNRQVRVDVSIPLLLEMMTTGWETGTNRILKCIKGLPTESKYVRGWVNEERNAISLVFSHPTFSEVDWGASIPMIEITMEWESLQDAEITTP